MYEYINIGILLISSIIIIMLLFLIIGQKSKLANMITLILLLFINFYIVYDDYATAQANIKYFQDGSILRCSNGFNTLYRVSKQNNWELDKNYFTKDSLLIRADKCELK